ncbi:MAG: alpha/beta hydrolase [Anaerolineae bacterium]|nr:alpha/beta hydrolase [Anaerolineae bacterium]
MQLFILLLMSVLVGMLDACDNIQALSIQSDGQLPMTNISYAQHEDGTLDVFLPSQTNEGLIPTVLLVHGTGVTKEYFQGTSTIEDLTTNGYAAVSINYRQPGLWNPDLWMADAVCALGWMYAHQDEYHFNMDTLAALGHSRGALIVSMLGAKDDLNSYLNGCEYSLPENFSLAGVIPYGGAFMTTATLSDPQLVGVFTQALGVTSDEAQRLIDYLIAESPFEWLQDPDIPEQVKTFLSYWPTPWIDGTEPPYLLLHGQVDEVASVQESQVFAEFLRERGIRAEFFIVPDAYHRMDQTKSHDQMISFLASIQS